MFGGGMLQFMLSALPFLAWFRVATAKPGSEAGASQCEPFGQEPMTMKGLSLSLSLRMSLHMGQ